MSKSEISKTSSFAESVDEAERLISSVYEAENKSLETLAEFINSEAQARAFFVAFLTRGSFDLESAQKVGIIDLIREKQDLTREVLIKNLAMSKAMGLHHMKNSQKDLANQSDLVHKRSIQTITLVGKERFQGQAKSLLEAIDLKLAKSASNGENCFTTFLERWQYDTTQLNSIKSSLTDLFG